MNHGVVTDVDDKIDDLPPEFVLGRKLQRRDKKEYFQYFSLPWPTSPSSEKLSLEQGGFVMDRRLQDLSLTVSLIIHIYKMTKQ